MRAFTPQSGTPERRPVNNFPQMMHGNGLVCVGYSLPAHRPPLAWSCPKPRFPLLCLLGTGQPRPHLVLIGPAPLREGPKKAQMSLVEDSVTFSTWLWSDNLKSVGLWESSLEPSFLICWVMAAELYIALPFPCHLFLEFGGDLCSNALPVTPQG